MTFLEACKTLNIEDYAEQIFNSNSHGELFHIWDYVEFAKGIKEDRDNGKEVDISWFREWFKDAVKMAQQYWNRPESVYQHIFTIFQEWIDQAKSSNEFS